MLHASSYGGLCTCMQNDGLVPLVQLVHTYSPALQRNDQALFHYGFIQAHDPPKLAAQDFPGGNLYDAPKYSEADYSEMLLHPHAHPPVRHCQQQCPPAAQVRSCRQHTTWYHVKGLCPLQGMTYMPARADAAFGGALVSRKELARLEGVLQRFPTTAEQDAQLLAGAGAQQLVS